MDQQRIEMSSEASLIGGILLILFIGAVIGWQMSHAYYRKHYNEILKASSDMLNVTTETLQRTLKRVKDKD